MSKIRKIKDMKTSSLSSTSTTQTTAASIAQKKTPFGHVTSVTSTTTATTPATTIIKKVVTLTEKEVEELVASSPSERNWRGIFIALLVIAAVLGLIVFSIFLLSPEDEGTRIKGRRLSLSDINGNGLKWRPFNGTWISDGKLVYRDPTGGLSILVIETFTVTILMTNSTFRQLNAEKFLISPDLKYVLLLSECGPDGSRYSVYEVQNRNTFPLSPRDGARKAPLLQHVIWAPNNPKFLQSSAPSASHVTSGGGSGSITSSGNINVGSGNGGGNGGGNKQSSQAIAFVYENDLYYKPKVQNDLVCRITTTGKNGFIYNGIPNWLYSNTPELMSDTLAFSPDGGYLSFLSFNDTLVDKYDYTWLGESWKYPRVKSIRYPKEGSNNPNVTVYVVDLSVLKFINKIQIHPPDSYQNNSYVGNMIWISTMDLSVTYTNREQTSALTLLCRAPTFNCREIHTETIVDNGLVLPADQPIFSKIDIFFKHANNSNSNFGNSTTTMAPDIGDEPAALNKNEFESAGFLLKRLPVRDGEHGYYRHVVFISTSDMRTVPLTMGRFEVTKIIGWDETNEIVYFMATPKLKPGQRHLYKINLRMNVTYNPNRVFITSSQPTCLTCDNSANTFRLLLSNTTMFGNSSFDDGGNNSDNYNREIPNNCLFNQIYMSPDFTYYVQECLGPATPSIYLVETQTRDKLAILHNGDLLRNRIKQIAVPQFRTFDVEIRHGFHAQVRLLLPPGMKEEEEMAFPLILHMDAAPGSQLVTERFYVDWNWYLCSQRAMIVAQIDARGSGLQGELLKSQVKSKLGTVEIEDQLGVLTYLRDNLKFIDPTRICAYGWGYGGYASAMTLSADSQRVLQCALSINPIVSFAHHSTFFTDRFMPHNDDYLRAIQESDLSMRAGNIESRNFFLIHGTADTLVHEQHSLMLARALIDQDIGFRHQVYADEGHHLSGVLTHLYKTIEWFFDESFGPIESSEWDPTGFFAFKQ